jgi:WD40 repeat protein
MAIKHGLMVIAAVAIMRLSFSAETNAGDNEPVVWKAHGDDVMSVAFSPDGKLLASGGFHDDPTIKLWDVSTHKHVRTLKGHRYAVNSVVISPDGTKLASGSSDRTIKLWDVATGENTATLLGHTEWVYEVVFSPDGKTLASASRDTTIKLWNVEAAKEIRTLRGHTDRVQSVAFFADGKQLVSGGNDRMIRFWDVATGAQTRVLQGHKLAVLTVAISPDGQMLASGSSDKTYRLWNLDTWKELASFSNDDGTVSSDGIPSTVTFFPDGKHLACAGAYFPVTVVELTTMERRTLGRSTLFWSLAVSPDSRCLATGDRGHEIALWELSDRAAHE